MPIKARIDMLSTGIRTPVGVKIFGNDLRELERLARDVETALWTVTGTASAYAERINGGYFLEIIPDRNRIARYGLSMEDVQNTIAMAIGAEPITTTVEGRERYAVVLRYPRDIRDDPDSIASDVLVSLPNGAAVPLGEVATITRTQGPTMIRTEDAQPVVYVFADIRDRDLGGYVREAQRAVAENVTFPAGYSAAWSGQFEYLERAEQRLTIVVPATLLLIFLLLYLNFRRFSDTLIVMLSLPFSLVGGFWLMYWMGFNMSIAAAVGFIALAGVAAQTGVIMLIYLEQAWRETKARRAVESSFLTASDLRDAVMAGAVERVRPKMMTVAAIMAGLIPILWSTGAGSEVMQRIAVPMIGGMVSSTVLTLVVIPVVYAMV
jgi:Cu(I)/Ag(I) efflux system membrane protein CusA/SilA